jgi:heme O synthase-like polyprenyltransferase
MIMTTETFFTILRTVIYLWISIELWNLAYLYWYGYNNVKTTPIIKSLQAVLTLFAVVFMSMAFVPIFYQLNKDVHAVFVSYLPLVLVPLGLALRKFRKESLTKQTMKLPDKRVK